MTDEVCPKCGSPLGEVTETSTGRKLQRCSAGSWNKETRQNEGCDYVKWLETPPETLDEKCPKCGSPLILQTTRFGKKMKKCSAGSWDKDAKKAIGCDYVEWINGTTEKLDEVCPECGKPLVLSSFIATLATTATPAPTIAPVIPAAINPKLLSLLFIFPICFIGDSYYIK